MKLRITGAPISNGAAFGTDYFSRTAVARSNIFVNQKKETKYFYQDLDQAGSVSAASGHRDQDTTLFIEAEFIDASSNQTVAKVVRKVFGSQVSNASQKITAQDFKAAIDKLGTDLQALIR